MTTRSPSERWDPPAGLVPGIDALGVYHLLRPIAAGGMARVWLAVDGGSGREVAVKRMLPALAADQELRRAFTDEGNLGLRLQHPNIVDTIELGETTTAIGTEPYLVLELLRGRALIDVLRAAGRQKREVPLGVAIRIVADAARGLEHAHQLTGLDGRSLGLVHRDVTPHNLFVCASGVIKLLDFGIAKASSQDHHTRTGTIKGKFAYLAPEQIRGQTPDARLDVFALGIVLYELLTGRPLFRGNNDAETLHRILSYDIPPPESVRKDVPSGLGAVALRALQRDRERRLPSAAALANAIEAVATAAGIEATASEVRAFTEELFPNDGRVHAADAALVRRTYEHLSSSSLRALGSNPWITPPEGMSIADRAPRPRFGGLLLGLGAVCITAAAAFGTSTLLRHRLLRQQGAAATHAASASAGAEPAGATPAGATPAAAPSALSEELPAPAVAHAVVPVERPSAEKQAAQHRHAHAGTGRLRIAVHPWAEVLVDGHSIGTTPLRPTELADGVHQIQLRNRDLGVSVRRKVTIQVGKETALVVDLFAAHAPAK